MSWYGRMSRTENIIVTLIIVALSVLLICIGVSSITSEAATDTPLVFKARVIEEIDIPIDDYKDAATYLAKAVYGEARGCSTTQQAAVIWCVLNRVDTDDRYSPEEVINVTTKKNQFHGYDPNNPVLDEHYDLAIDVLSRWLREKTGETEVGRVLPAEYLYFGGDGKVNRFRTDWIGGTRWDWSLKSPYEEV